jgi:hypothetical protein
VAVEFAQQLIKALKSTNTKQGPPPPPVKPSDEFGEPKAQASRLELKTVNEVYVFDVTKSTYADMILLYSWDEKAYKYTITESPKSIDESNELDQYVFVVRTRIG